MEENILDAPLNFFSFSVITDRSFDCVVPIDFLTVRLVNYVILLYTLAVFCCSSFLFLCLVLVNLLYSFALFVIAFSTSPSSTVPFLSNFPCHDLVHRRHNCLFQNVPFCFYSLVQFLFVYNSVFL